MRAAIACLVCVAALVGGLRGAAAPQTDETELLDRLAVDLAAQGPIPPIEMTIERPMLHVYDRFRLVALAARAAADAGRPLDPSHLPAELREPRTIVIALRGSPLDDHQPARGLELQRRKGPRAKRASLTSDALRVWLPGVDVPGDAFSAAFDIASLQPGDRIKILSFASRVQIGMPGMPNQVVAGPSDITVNFSVPKELSRPAPRLPEGYAPGSDTAVTVEGVLDLDGRVRYARAIDGPAALRDAAVAAVGEWHYEPARMWKSPVPLVMRASVTFDR